MRNPILDRLSLEVSFLVLAKRNLLTIMFVDLALLDEEISEVNMMVKKLDSEVSSFVALLRAAQDRLHKAQERKEQLIDDKQKLLDKKRNVTVKSDVIDVNPAIKTTPEALSSYFTYVVPVPVPTVLSLGLSTLSN